jgi:hypothetical protein
MSLDLLRTLPGVRQLWNWVRSRLGLIREHDVAIFKKLDAILDEPGVDKILNHSIHTSYLQVEEKKRLLMLVENLQRVENQYLQSVVRLRAEELAWEREQLLGIIDKTFGSVRPGYLGFRPDPIDPTVYDVEWNVLNKKLETAWSAYRAYRSAVKERLWV